MSITKCPKCFFEFDAEENLKERVDGISSVIGNFARKRSEPLFKKNNGDVISDSILTVCPSCKYEFPISTYKFFGILSAMNMRYLLIFFIGMFILFAVLILIKDLI